MWRCDPIMSTKTRKEIKELIEEARSEEDPGMAQAIISEGVTVRMTLEPTGPHALSPEDQIDRINFVHNEYSLTDEQWQNAMRRTMPPSDGDMNGEGPNAWTTPGEMILPEFLIELMYEASGVQSFADGHIAVNEE